MLQLKVAGRCERDIDFRLICEGNNSGILFSARIRKIAERALKQPFLERAGALEISDDVGCFSRT